jgi:dipeptidyl aminopeptidase/acylaminoacyl peptidase
VKLERYTYKSFDGTSIEAGILKPSAPKPGKRPLIVVVHGGPTGRWSDSLEPWGQTLASHGYLVFYPNIRGSIGYGNDFIVLNRRDWGGNDFKDVMSGVDDLIQKGIADPEKLAIGGWSYGGYMSAWAITQTNRFKAAVAGACMSDLASEFGTEEQDTNYYDFWFNGSPYENQDVYLKGSPMTFIRNARTPTLILQGENDVIDPIGQSQQLYRGLKYQSVEAELVLYPREGHGFREEKHRIDVLTRIVAWFDRFLQ